MWLAYTAAALAHVVLVLTVVLISAAVFIWMERKVAGRIQDRLGPTRVGGRFGWLQSPADGLKLLCKEDIIPAGGRPPALPPGPVHQLLRRRSAVFLALPFANGWVRSAAGYGRLLHPGRGRAGGLRRDPGRLCLGLEVVALRGDARGGPGRQLRNPAGHVRRRARAAGRHHGPGRHRQRPGRLVSATGSCFTTRSPSCTFWIYVTCATAGVNRAPFDLPEAESELVAGFMTEYSGFRWAMFLMAEYTAMFVVSCAGRDPVSAAAGTGRCRWPTCWA